eukprot:CAMPEP_0178843568 /NCGR_PEP_ID=MMETSP0746-20121128/16236_1 /TAXON_ID=913974 /ORGANISM="Nitzschia punctata, Strain CCMP561" /LENGTH=57 /DNA_ID=CAMNT_0020507231 /DNA_START=363 /DNA_END=536 /DNA_ORIENTATION=+
MVPPQIEMLQSSKSERMWDGARKMVVIKVKVLYGSYPVCSALEFVGDGTTQTVVRKV